MDTLAAFITDVFQIASIFALLAVGVFAGMIFRGWIEERATHRRQQARARRIAQEFHDRTKWIAILEAEGRAR